MYSMLASLHLQSVAQCPARPCNLTTYACTVTELVSNPPRPHDAAIAIAGRLECPRCLQLS